MHDELILDEIKGIGLGFERVFYHIGDSLFAERREFVNVLARVFRIGNAKTEFKVEGFEQFVAEKMALDHPESIDRPIAHAKFHGGAHGLQSEMECMKVGQHYYSTLLHLRMRAFGALNGV